MTPKLPRDLSGQRLARALAAFGYTVTRQTGSHLRLTTSLNGEHHVIIPDHGQLEAGTLPAILGEIARHLETSKDELASRLFG